MPELTGAILAGGLGTRLRSVVSDRPKVLALVRGKPFLAYLLDQVGDAGIRRVVLLTGYKGEQIEETFGSRYGNIQLEYSAETEGHWERPASCGWHCPKLFTASGPP